MSLPRLGPSTGLYLLLEPHSSINIVAELYQREATPQWYYLFTETPWASCLSESPALIRSREKSPFLGWALEHLYRPGEGLRGLLLETTEAPGPVLGWARRALSLPVPGQSEVLLRYYDPVVWASLQPQDKGDGLVIQGAHYWSEPEKQWRYSARPGLSGHPTRSDPRRETHAHV